MTPWEIEKSKFLVFADLLDKVFPAERDHEKPGGYNIRCLLDSIASKDGEIARLQAQLAQAERVVVPELDAPTVCGLIEAYDDDPREINGVRTSENINAWFRENSHSVPASRVLKDGEVAVRNAEWEAAGNLLFSARTAWVECETSGECDMSAVTKAAKSWDAIRTQGKEGAP